jgi:hypothetical protein
MPAQKASRPAKGQGREWYSVSVETLRGWGLLLLTLLVLGLGYVGYRIWEERALERDAARILEETDQLVQRLHKEEQRSRFDAEYQSAWQGYQEARTAFDAGDHRTAVDLAGRSRNVLLSILDALALPSSSSQAQFISLQGQVEYRRGDGGDWKEARSRVPLHAGDYVRTGGNGSAEIMFLDGTLYIVRPNTQFIVSLDRAGAGGQRSNQAIEMKYGWVDLSTEGANDVRTPGAVATVEQDSDAFVSVDRETNTGRFGTFRGRMELASESGVHRQVGELEQVEQKGGLLSEAKPLPGRPELAEPSDNLALDLGRADRLVLSWSPVEGAGRYALQISRSHHFVDNLIDVDDREKTQATLGLRGEGTFQWRVAAFDREGLQGPWSKPRRFRVASFRAVEGERDDTPPMLELEDVKTYGTIFIVDGRTEPGAVVEVNGEAVKAEGDGTFTKPVQLTKEGWSFIEVRARDGWGNESVRRHRVFVDNP